MVDGKTTIFRGYCWIIILIALTLGMNNKNYILVRLITFEAKLISKFEY